MQANEVKIGETLEFLYTDKKNKKSERRGVVVPNSKTVSASTHLTLDCDGVVKSFALKGIEIPLYTL